MVPAKGESPVFLFLQALLQLLNPIGETHRKSSVEFITLPVIGLQIYEPGSVEINIPPAREIHMFADRLVPSYTPQTKTPLLRVFVTGHDQTCLGVGHDRIKTKRQNQWGGNTHDLKIGRSDDDLFIGYDFLLVAPNPKMRMVCIAGSKNCICIVDRLRAVLGIAAFDKFVFCAVY